MYGFIEKLLKYKTTKRGKILIITILTLISVAYYFALSFPVFKDPYSTVLESRDGELLGALIADDGQWRFPENDSIPEKFRKCITYFEDEYFFYHPGFNPVSMGKALVRNINAGEIVRGGSTLTMQVIRLSRNKDRTVFEKIIEIILSTRLELKYSKEKILSLYAAHAPFGGNVVGLDAASWRYYNRQPEELSWAEMAALAVLPNSPSLVYPGKNQTRLRAKRDFLLKKLYDNGEIDSLTYELALTEPLPGEPHLLPQLAPHLLQRISQEGYQGKSLVSSISYHLQGQVNDVVNRHIRYNKNNGVNNAAALVLSVESGEVLAYTGNGEAGIEHNQYVDIITAPRSTGSILKPFLYAGLLDDGVITPQHIYPDIPTFFEGFAPENFDKSFDGAVAADEVIIRSLNVPSVYMLRDYGHEKFHFLLNKVGLTTINKPPGYYGLSLILGGAEATLWDLSAAYAGMARTLNHYNDFLAPNRYDKSDFHANTYQIQGQKTKRRVQGKNADSYLSAPAIWFTFNALQDLNRPVQESSWKLFNSSRKIAWKTGTSYGFRDAWAIGVTPEYVVAVWVGNADGEGRPGLTGLLEAAPVLFDIYDKLPQSTWFERPFSGISEVEICKNSGYRAGNNCPEVEKRLVPESTLKTVSCPKCILVHLDRDERFRVSDQCFPTSEMVHKKWFHLPPVQEWYYKKKNPFYKKIPDYAPECRTVTEQKSLDLIYPKPNAKVYIPRMMSGEMGEVVLEAAHSDSNKKIYWHLDDEYLGETRSFHQKSIFAPAGKHTLTLVDEDGNTIQTHFSVISR